MKTDPAPGTRVRFGTFEANLRSGELRREGLKVKIQELPFQVLVALLERPGEVVTREELRKRLWAADTFVDFEHGLSKAINKLREALDDDANNPRFVETLTRRGYRFIGPVEAVAGFQLGRPIAVRVTVFSTAVIVVVLGALFAFNVAGLRNRVMQAFREPPHQIHSIAVLPLENLSADPEQEYFAVGMTDELITELSKISALRVIARASVMRYKETKKPLPEIAKELNVDAVIEASVLRSDNRVRINAQLVDASTQRNLWSASYERESRDVLSLQRDVAEAIVEKIQVRMTPQERQLLRTTGPIVPAAYNAYLRGRYLVDRRSAADAALSTRFFRQAINLDPEYASAYAGLAGSLVSQSLMETARPDDVMPQARAAALHALQLNPDLGEAYTVLGEIERLYQANWRAAEENFKRGIELSPSDPFAEIKYAYCLADLGRLREALGHAQRALELDPVSFYANRTLASMLYFARRYDAALAQFQRTRELHGDPAAIDNWVASIYEKKGMFDKAVQADLNSFGGPAAELNFYRAAYTRSGWRGYCRARVERLLPRANEGCAPSDMARAYLRLGDADKAFYWLNRSIDQHCTEALRALVDPEMDPIRADRRFPALLHRVNLPPQIDSPKP